MTVNKELDLAWDFVNNTDRNIFLTGKAGTGKTTFLHHLKLKSLKRMVVVAPTGVAAINAKGVTIHSFFQMPFGPILPNDALDTNSRFVRKFSKTKIDIIRSLDLLVIDEISMVRADLLDGIDKVLRRYKNRNLVFGGVQLLMIGDLQQLSPVIKENEWHLLKTFYKNAFFFSSLAYQKSDALTIELKHIYRQDNPVFIDILNEIRTNTLSEQSAFELNKSYNPDFSPHDNEGYIFLTTHNKNAERVNVSELEKLTTETKTYTAKIEGKFPEFSYPTAEELALKVGAQVMFVKNDSSVDKEYFNGKIGKIIFLDRDEVVVKCPDDDFNIVVKPEVWENINYNINRETKAITENRVGSYTQIPLRLAWSITIHKSQGLTFEKAIIDAQGAFAHGQTYVALSRCKSLEGLVLKSKINSSQIINDTDVANFTQDSEQNAPSDSLLNVSKSNFQLNLIAELFNYYEFLHPVNRGLDIFYKNRGSIEGNFETSFLQLKEQITSLLKVASAFNAQLKELSIHNIEPENNENVQERFKKGLRYFNDMTKAEILERFNSLAFNTDNQALQTDINKHLDRFEELLLAKQLYFKGLAEGFKTLSFLELRAKSKFLAKDKPKKPRKTIVDGTANVELFELLRELRNTIAEREDLIHYQIFTQKSLYAMCETLPISKTDLKAIHGMGKTRVEKYGPEILEVIKVFCENNDVETDVVEVIYENPKSKIKRKKGDTKKESLSLFQVGKSVSEIADIRELNENTIIGHLSSFIPSGEISITDLISEDHYKELKTSIPQQTFETLSDLKHKLDDKYSYAEIRLVLDELTA
ncbi:MAG: helix-turn-helix domain-containing protein [Psychroserpens sp.]|uniref:helix-turn-helix domain-containing protein n=1 Tax=Psychroserpens sp. TaxID=2020870 RepID=UPI003C73082C